ncbi:MAG: hypothetical protein HYX68_29575 [Planctomycetes bacterium]|nr:hypothetical protein [Planctomycetota bacterium]
MLRIKGGKVYDPAHNINGVVQDICMDNGLHDSVPARTRRSSPGTLNDPFA